MKIRAITLEEWKYTFKQSQQLTGMTGCIGYLRGDFGKSGSEFYSTWFDLRKELKTEEFKRRLDTVINNLRSDAQGLLKDYSGMKEYVRQYPASHLEMEYCTQYGFRIDFGKYVYLLRCNIQKNDYNFYCYCYIEESLDKHIKNAEKGISFITPHYEEMFRISDGGKVFHICEFAEHLKKAGSE